MAQTSTILDKIIHPDERVAVFIDGANLYSTARGLAFDMDYKKLLEAFKQRGLFIRASYYTALVEDQDFSPIRPLVDWLDYNGYTLVTKPAREFTDATGRRRFKGDMDIEIAIDMMEAAAHADHLFLFSGDGDFAPLVQRFAARAYASAWSPPSDRTRRWPPTNSAGPLTISSTSPTSQR